MVSFPFDFHMWNLEGCTALDLPRSILVEETDDNGDGDEDKENSHEWENGQGWNSAGVYKTSITQQTTLVLKLYVFYSEKNNTYKTFCHGQTIHKTVRKEKWEWQHNLVHCTLYHACLILFHCKSLQYLAILLSPTKFSNFLIHFFKRWREKKRGGGGGVMGGWGGGGGRILKSRSVTTCWSISLTIGRLCSVD